MKQRIYILGVLTFLIIVTGVFFKLNHWPGAGYLFAAGMILFMLLFLPLALTDHYRAQAIRKNLFLHIVIWLTCLVIFTSMLFKVQHWPGAGILLAIAIPFPYLVFLPVFLASTAKDRNQSIHNTVFVLFLLALNSVFAALLALNVSKDRIADSYNLSRQYNRVEKILDEIPLNVTASPVNIKIDDALKIIREYKELILGVGGTSHAEWEESAGIMLMTDSGRTRRKVMSVTGNAGIGEKLESGLAELISVAVNTPAYTGLAATLPQIFGLALDDNNRFTFDYQHINSNLSWAMIYLDGLETNLKLLRLSLPE